MAFSDVDGASFVLPSGQGYVKTSIRAVPLGYHRNGNFLYSQKGGLFEIDVNLLQGRQVYQYEHDGKNIEAISPDGTKFLMSANTSGAGIYIKNSDGSGLAELR